MEDSLYHSGSKPENREVHARSLREGTEYIWGTNCKSVKGAEKPNKVPRDISEINISRKPLQSRELKRPKEEMLLPDSRSEGCPVRTGSTSEFTWLELDHGGSSCPAGVGTTEMILCKQKEAKNGGGGRVT